MAFSGPWASRCGSWCAAPRARPAAPGAPGLRPGRVPSAQTEVCFEGRSIWREQEFSWGKLRRSGFWGETWEAEGKNRNSRRFHAWANGWKAWIVAKNDKPKANNQRGSSYTGLCTFWSCPGPVVALFVREVVLPPNSKLTQVLALRSGCVDWSGCEVGIMATSCIHDQTFSRMSTQNFFDGSLKAITAQSESNIASKTHTHKPSPKERRSCSTTARGKRSVRSGARSESDGPTATRPRPAMAT